MSDSSSGDKTLPVDRAIRFLLRRLGVTKSETLREIVSVEPPGVVKPLRFHVSSDVERFRTVQFGGEREALEQVTQRLRGDDVVWDIGSNIGLNAIVAARLAAQGMVYCFEPDPDIHARLLENAALNSLTNLVAENIAISSEPGELQLHTDGVHGFSPTVGANYLEEERTVKIVECKTVDQLVNDGFQSPTVMKIDVEGFEYEVLKGMRRTLHGKVKPRVIFIELHPIFLAQRETSVTDCRQAIESAGYSLTWSHERNDQIILIYEDASSGVSDA